MQFFNSCFNCKQINEIHLSTTERFMVYFTQVKKTYTCIKCKKSIVGIIDYRKTTKNKFELTFDDKNEINEMTIKIERMKKLQNILGLLFIILGLLGCLLITIFITIPYIINPLFENFENLLDEFFKDKITGID